MAEAGRAAFGALAPGRAFGLMTEARDPASVVTTVADAEHLT
ncbi:hypothetical protein [Lichenicola cladoniae]|nr:hypothetical protein [Lichenicola cladoniae]